VSLEARPPYLDHRVVEFAYHLPSQYKVRYFKGKYILRKIASQSLPSNIAWRRKHGFIVPISKWINHQSQDWLRATLNDPRLESAGMFNLKVVNQTLDRMNGSSQGEEIVYLWPMIVLSIWLKSL